MKKFIAIAILTVCIITTFCGCNKQSIDLTYSFDKAIVKMPDDTVKEIYIKSWTDYEDGEQIQIVDKEGNTYLVSSFNCVLVNEK